ncbi:Ni,Fe-hydrogenase I large subunit [Paramagnetospirillum marisnigri]|uniref:Ni,Fe-hydrogenase I large subunit n=1 Tax=Paramagnetospirillum marisnigri TaxID=1285242 RepID=A0A178MPE6_9PROT|nr:nickel-dependent hydrogenase large subunit [Paramagnetospirillum marisnigri]OAN50670.1 Ni,Fe-hydrogenase I large subunit [Paramagnetospirillum marisnigri]
MLPVDTGLSVTLSPRDGRIADVDIRSGRLVQASRLLVGKPPAQVGTILPSLYSLCGTAQGLAGAEAMEQALGLGLAPAQRTARRFLLLVETITEHAAAILRDWALLLGGPPDAAAVKPLRPLLATARRALYPQGDWARVGGGGLLPDVEALAGLMRGLSQASERGRIAATPLLDRVEAKGLGGFGVAPFRPMPENGPADLAERLAKDEDGAYVACPDYRGESLETGPLARRRDHALIAGLMARHGAGLMPRFMARLLDMAAALREAEELVQDLTEAPSGTEPPLTDGVGLSRIEAARGLLVHRVEMEKGVVRRYQILAPTEWNFHPKGAFAKGLTGVAAGSDPVFLARLLAAALDPCVTCDITVAGHA